jgi:hypothetical protein
MAKMQRVERLFKRVVSGTLQLTRFIYFFLYWRNHVMDGCALWLNWRTWRHMKHTAWLPTLSSVVWSSRLLPFRRLDALIIDLDSWLETHHSFKLLRPPCKHTARTAGHSFDSVLRLLLLETPDLWARYALFHSSVFMHMSVCVISPIRPQVMEMDRLLEAAVVRVHLSHCLDVVEFVAIHMCWVDWSGT